MLDFIPDWSHLLPFMAAALALNLTPGADMTYVLARSLGQGRSAGLASAFGIGGGSVLHTILAAIGVSALLAASETGFLILKYAGIAYLLYLALRSFLRAESAAADLPPKPAPLWRIFGEGVLVNLFNPKVALFILAFLPQFVQPEKGYVWAQILVLGSCFNISGTAVNSAVAVAAAHFSERLRHAPKLRRWLDRIAATLLGALAIRMVFVSRN